MHITPSQISAIQQKASTLIERHGSALISAKIMDVLPIHQLMQWDQRLSGSHSSSLLKRLSFFQNVKPQIKTAQQKYEHDLKNQSGWIKEFRDILGYYNTDVLHSPPVEYKNTRQEAFQSLVMPFVGYALRSLADTKGFPGHLIAPDTLVAHCRSLVQILSRLSAQCFYAVFDDFRKTHEKSATDKKSNELYQKFETSMYTGGIIGFFEEYSALARLLTTVTQQWIQSTRLMIERLQSDLHDIATTFYKGRPLGMMKSMKTGFSAPHSVDGLVFELTFSQGGKVIYKPRSGSTDLALSGIISWLNTSHELEPMRTVVVLDRNQYSWHEYIGKRASRSKSEVEQYYTRIGQQAALLHVLGSTDYHFENLRARGAHPYLTDNETLLSPYLKISEDQTVTGDELLDREVTLSLARSLFLLDTRRLFNPDSESISGVFDSTDHYEVIGYRNTNTDEMYSIKKHQTRKGNNIPALGGNPVNPREYVLFIKKGYERTLRLIITKREEFQTLVKSSTLYFNMQVRLLIRPTKVYGQVLFESLRPEFFSDGVDRSLVFEQLARLYTGSHSSQERGKLLFEEIAMLQDHLVPWFHVQMNQREWSYTAPACRPGRDGRSIIQVTAQQVFEENMRRLDAGLIELLMALLDYYLAHQS